MKRILALLVVLVFLGGCSWLEKQNAEFCVVYKGRQICATRKDGVWSFSADLTKEEQEAIVRDIDK